MTIYIAGKITGDPDYRIKFAAAAQQLGSEYPKSPIFNPALAPEGLSAAAYMRLAFTQIDASDLVVFLPDWADSRGARLERNYCAYIGKAMLVWHGSAPEWVKEGETCQD